MPKTKTLLPRDYPTPYIQCYSPDFYHCPQAIVMDEVGKQKLLEALQSNKEQISFEAFTTDGEGYTLTIICKPFNKITEYEIPYIEEKELGMARNGKDPRVDKKFDDLQ